MSALRTIYQRMRATPDPSVDQAMAAALPTADPSAIRLMGLILLARQQVEGVTALIRQYDRLDPDIQAEIVRGADRWHRALRQAAAARTTTPPSNAIRIIVAAGAAQMAYLITQQLFHRPPMLRAQAAAGLLELACRQPQSASGGGVAAQLTQTAIEDAVKRYRAHQQPAVLLALAAMSPRPIPAILKQFDDPEDVAGHMLGRMLAYKKDPILRRSMMVMIQAPALTQPVLQGMARAASDGGMVDVLRHAHLLISPKVSGPLRAVSHPAQWWPGQKDLARWPTAMTLRLVWWAGALPWSPRRRVDKLAQIIDRSDELARLAAIRQLITIANLHGDQTRANEIIAHLCADPNESLARIALRHLIGIAWQELPCLLGRLVNSPHRSIAQLAREHVAPIGFERLWDGWAQWPVDRRLALGRALLKIAPTFHPVLAARLTGGSRADQMRALSIIQTLGQGDRFERTLVALAHHTDNKIASAAIRALGWATSPAATQVLERSMAHPDSRVRANAIEVLGPTQAQRHLSRLYRLANADAGRCRANAIRALLTIDTGQALSCLDRMLIDPDPTQRSSALWLVENQNVTELAGRVAEMSITDLDRTVRHRADHLIHGLVGLMASNEPNDAQRAPQPPHAGVAA